MATRDVPETAPKQKNRFVLNLLTCNNTGIINFGSVRADNTLSTSSERVFVFRDLQPYANSNNIGKYRVRVSYSNTGTHTLNGNTLYTNIGLLEIRIPGAQINNYINGTQAGIYRLVKNSSYKRDVTGGTPSGTGTHNTFNEYDLGNDIFGDIVQLRPQNIEIRIRMHTLKSTDPNAYNTTPWDRWTSLSNNIILEFEEM